MASSQAPASSQASASSQTSASSSATASTNGLPLQDQTGSATQVITVLAASTASTIATVQAWNRTGNRWTPDGPKITGNLGSAGLTTTPRESRSATPIGSFSLTQAFGAHANPGTTLPYFQTTPSDWWISQSGPLYNTHQRCSSSCSFVRGAPNEHLFYETPAYNYAVVINYNTAEAGPIVRGAGSAFFLHVSNGRPTAGCVSIPQEQLIRLLRWFSRAAHPRILIGIRAN